MSKPKKNVQKNLLEESFRWAGDADRRLKVLSKMQFSSTDPNADFEETRRFMEAVFRAQVSFHAGEVNAAGERREAFAPDTDLGDLLLIARGDEDALVRFVGRHPQPIYRAKWNSFRKEFNEGIRDREGVASRAARHGARVLSRGWETRKRRGPNAKKKPSRMGRRPLEKLVDLGDGSPVMLREPAPPELADVLSGDAATFGDRLLRVSIVGAGGWRAKSPEDVEAFLREMYYSPEELGTLLREAQAFIVDCVMHGNGTGAAFYEMNKAATAYLSGGRTRSEMVKARRGEDMFDGDGEETLMSEEPDPLDALIAKEEEDLIVEEEDPFPDLQEDDRLTARDRIIAEARAEGKTWKKIATDLGISYGYARNLGSILEKKIPRP